MANRYMKTCTTLQITREMKIKTTKSYHHTTVRMAITKKNTNNKCWRECEEREPLYTVGGNVSWGSHREKQYRSFSKNKTELPYDPTALPRWFSGKESAYQCKRHEFNIQVGKISGEGNGNPLQSSCLGNPMDREVWKATVHGVAKESDNLVTKQQ